MPKTESHVAPTQGRGSAWTLARRLAKLIGEGTYPPGARLPSYRQLMDEYGLTSGVVSYAMSILAEQGHIERRHGSGVYVRAPRLSSTGKQRQTGLFALVVPDIESGLYLSIQAGMESEAQKNRAQLITMTTGANMTQQADVLLQLIDREVAGVALVPCFDSSHAYQLRHLHKANIPLVLLHRGVSGVPAPVIDIPFAEVGRTAGHAIGKMGHDNAGAFFGVRSTITDQYLEGYRLGLKDYGAALDDASVTWSDTMVIPPQDCSRHREKVGKAIVEMLTRPDRPTALFVSFDRLAVMVYLEAVRQGVRVPADLSIVSFGGNRLAGSYAPHLACVVVDEYHTGQKAYALLGEMHRGDRPIENSEKFTMTVTFDCGESLAPPSNAKPRTAAASAGKQRRK